MEAAKKADFTDIIIINETRGNPDNLIVCHLPYGPTAYFTLSNCILRHDIPEVTPSSLQYPHLILDGLNSKIGQRISRILQVYHTYTFILILLPTSLYLHTYISIYTLI